MPVSPPYSIIDSIARLRESAGAAWGQAASNIGGSIGQGVASAGKDLAQPYHEAMLEWDKNYDTTHGFGNNATPASAPGANPPSGAQPPQPTVIGGPQPPNAPMSRPTAAAPAPPGAVPPASGSPGPQPAAQGGGQGGQISLADYLKAHNLRPFKGSDKMFGTPKSQEKTQAAITINTAKTAAAAEAKEVPVTASVKAMYKKAGLPEPTEKTINRDDFEAAKTLANTSAAAAGRSSNLDKTLDTKLKTIAMQIQARIDTANKSADTKAELQAQKEKNDFIIKNPKYAAVFGVPEGVGEKPSTSSGDPVHELLKDH